MCSGVRGAWYGGAGNEVFMTENKTDIKTRYEFLIAGILVLVVCICAFAIYRVTKYTRNNNPAEPVIAMTNSDGTVLIEVEISQETSAIDESVLVAELEAEAAEKAAAELEIQNAHNDIMIFTTTNAGDNYYKSRDGRITLYTYPKESGTDEERPTLQEDRTFEVVGFSRDGWAAIELGGQIYYVKSADLVKTQAPEDAVDKHKDPENSQKIRFFTPTTGNNYEYVVTMNTKAFSLPDVESSGISIDLKKGERVLVSAISGDWFKIVYMNAEYYVLSYLAPREVYIEENPGEEIVDNTGYAPAGSAEAASSAAAASGSTGSSTPADNSSGSSGSDDSTGSDDSGSSYSGSSSYVWELLSYTNELRESEGLEPLVWSGELAYCAAVRAEELPELSYEQNVNHQRPDGSPWYTVNEDIMYAENIAYGQTSAYEVFEAWKNSPGHYKNMMNPDYRTFGAALYYTDGGYNYYWIEEFGY